MATIKDTNKYQIHMEFDAKEEKGTIVFAKNSRMVSFEELPQREKEVYLNMLADTVSQIFKTEGEGESDSSQEQP